MKKTSLLIILVCSWCQSSASTDTHEKYHYCEVFGIAGGAGDSFTQNVAGRILDRKGLTFDDVCGAVKRDSYKFGIIYGQKKEIPMTDHLRWMKYQDFRDKVMDSILENIEY